MKKPLATGVEAALLTVGAAPAAAEFIIQERDGVLYVKNVEPPAAAVTSKPRGGAASAESYRALIRETAERPATVTASVTAADKTYDGTTVATITACTLSGGVAGDAVTCAAGSASFSDPNPGPNKAVTATGVTLSGAAAGNYQLGSTTATTTASIIYGFAGLQSPYLLPSQGAFQIKSAIPLKWQYLNNAGSVINSSAAGPVVGIAGPYTCGGDDSLAPVVTANDAGNSGYKYDSTTNTWQFNWKTTGLTAGCYTIKIHSGQSGQENGPFPIQLKSK